MNTPNEKQKLDLTKPVQTRDGRKARIVCTDMKHHLYTVLALVAAVDENEKAHSYTKDGIFQLNFQSANDLINVPEPEFEVELIYFKDSGKYYTSGKYITHHREMYNVFDEVKEMKKHGKLPGISNEVWTSPILVNSSTHPNFFPTLIL